MIQKIKDYWLGLSDETRAKIISAWDTFSSTFLTCLFIAVEAGVQWTWAFWGSVLATALRAAFKATRQKFAPESLGGIPR